MAFLTFNFFKIWEIDILKNSYFEFLKFNYFLKSMVRYCYFCQNRWVLSYFLTYQKMVTFWTYAGESGTTLIVFIIWKLIKEAIISLIQHFEAGFLWKVSLKILNSGLILKTFTHAQCSASCEAWTKDLPISTRVLYHYAPLHRAKCNTQV